MIIAILDEKKCVTCTVKHDPNKDPRPEGIECDDSVYPGMIWDGKQFQSAPPPPPPIKTIQQQIDDLMLRVDNLEKTK